MYLQDFCVDFILQQLFLSAHGCVNVFTHGAVEIVTEVIQVARMALHIDACTAVPCNRGPGNNIQTLYPRHT